MGILSGFLGILNNTVPGSILISTSTSLAVNMNGFSLVGIKVPAAFTGTALTFTMCDTVDGTYVPVKGTSGSTVSYTVAQGNYYAIDPKDFHGIQFLKIVSNGTEAAARTLLLSLKGF